MDSAKTREIAGQPALFGLKETDGIDIAVMAVEAIVAGCYEGANERDIQLAPSILPKLRQIKETRDVLINTFLEGTSRGEFLEIDWKIAALLAVYDLRQEGSLEAAAEKYKIDLRDASFDTPESKQWGFIDERMKQLMERAAKRGLPGFYSGLAKKILNNPGATEALRNLRLPTFVGDFGTVGNLVESVGVEITALHNKGKLTRKGLNVYRLLAAQKELDAARCLTTFMGVRTFEDQLRESEGYYQGVKVVTVHSRHAYDYDNYPWQSAPYAMATHPYLPHPDMPDFSKQYMDRFWKLSAIHHRLGRA